MANVFDQFDTQAQPAKNVFDQFDTTPNVFDRFDPAQADDPALAELKAASVPSVKPMDTSGLQLSPYDRFVLQAAAMGTRNPEELGNKDFLTAVANNPIGFLKSLPGSAGAVMAAPGQVAYYQAADAISKLFGEPEYGGNIKAMEQGKDVLPADAFVAKAAKTNPNLAVTANLGKAGAEMAPSLGLAAAPGAVTKLLAAGFSAQMIASAPQLFESYANEINKKPEDEQDAGKLAELKSQMLQTFVFAPLAGAHAAGGAVDLAATKLADKYVPRGAGVKGSVPIASAIAHVQTPGSDETQNATPTAPETFSEFGGEIQELPGAPTPAPVPETPDTIQAQVQATQDPDTPKAVTLVTPGAVIPENHGLTEVETAQGTALVNPDKIDPAEAKTQLDAGGGGKLLGMSTDEKPEGATAVLQTKTADGTPIQDEVVTPTTLPTAAEAGRQLAPDGTQVIKTPEQVIAERQGGENRMVLAAADEPRRPGLNAPWLEANVGDLKLPGAPEVKIVQSVKDLPEKERSDAEARAAGGRIVRGMLSDDGQTAYLVADNIHDVTTGRETYLEETLGHAGMEPLIKPQEEAKLFDLIQRGAPEEAKRIAQVYEHDLTTAAGRREFLGEFVAKASRWQLQKPRLWQAIADVLRRAAYRVGWLRNIPPDAMLGAVMRGLAKKGAARLAAKAAEAAEGRLSAQSSRTDLTTGPRFSLASDDEGETAQSKLASRALADPNVAPAVKAAINPEYEIKPLAATATQANAILQRGLDAAIAEHHTNPNLPEDVRVALGALIDEQMRTQAAIARAQGKTKLAELWEQRQVDFFNGTFRPEGTELGRAVNAFKLFGANSAQTWLKEYSSALADSVGSRFDRVKGAADNIIRTLRQANDDALSDLRTDPIANAGAREAVDEAITNSPATHQAVVMDLAGPWSESPEIVRMAREQVRAKADELLNRGPRPPGLTPAQHLRGLMDDLAKRAAEIASNHYQGAEPGVILRDKLMQRLGLGEDAATRMAKRLDEEFARQVKAVSDKMDARIATVRAKQGELREATQKLNVERRALAAAHQTVREAAARAAQEDAARRVAQTSGKQAVQKVQASAAQRALDAANKTVREAAARAAKAENELRAKQAEMMKWSNVEKSIHNELREWNEKLGQIVTRPPSAQDAMGNLVVERLLKQSGLEGPKAEKLKAILQDRWNALATERKQKMLNQIISPQAQKLLAKPGLADRIVKYSNLGAFADAKVYDAIKEKLNLPAYDPAVAREITRRANELQTMPRGSLQQAKGAEDLLAYIAKQRGMKPWEMAQSYWYANLLSGLTTQAKVAIYNLSSLGAHTFAQMVRHPDAIPQIIEALGRAVPKGVDTAGAILRDGTAPGIGVKMFEHGHGMEQWSGTAAKIATPWKVMLRSLGAQHLLLFKPAAEIKAAILAREMAKTEGAADTAARAREILGWTDAARGNAEAQAEAEGLKGLDYRRRVQEIVEQTRPPELQAAAMEWAKRGTAVAEPYGVLGAVTRGFDTAAKSAPILNLIVPFRRIVANVANDALGWTPLGWAERMLEYRNKGTMFGNPVNADQLADAHAQAIVGTTALAAIAYAAANGAIGVTAQGPASPEQRKTLHSTTGWIPYSLKIGNHYLSYMDRPGGIPLAIVGHYMDAMRYQKLDQEDALNRVAYATLGARSVILDSGWLQGLAGLFNQADAYTTKNASERIGTQFAKTLSGFVPMSQMVKQIDRLFDPQVYDADGVRAKFLMQLPFVRKQGQPVLNRFGQPITSSPADAFLTKEKPDPIVSLLLAKKALPSDIGKGELTNNEYYILVKRAGPMFYKALVQNAADIAGKQPQDAKALVERLSNQTTEEAKKALGFDNLEKLRKAP